MNGVNHRLTIRWTDEPFVSEELEQTVHTIRHLVGGDWVGHVYDQCDEDWNPIVEEPE